MTGTLAVIYSTGDYVGAGFVFAGWLALLYILFRLSRGLLRTVGHGLALLWRAGGSTARTGGGGGLGSEYERHITETKGRP